MTGNLCFLFCDVKVCFRGDTLLKGSSAFLSRQIFFNIFREGWLVIFIYPPVIPSYPSKREFNEINLFS